MAYRPSLGVHLPSSVVLEALVATGKPMSTNEILGYLGTYEHTTRNLRDVANRCGYLVTNGHATRVGHGEYQATNKEATVTVVTQPEAVEEDRTDRTCEECGYLAASAHGLKAHTSRSHKKTASGINADEAFEITGRALEILFPNGVPMARLIEVAEMQKMMLKWVSR